MAGGRTAFPATRQEKAVFFMCLLRGKLAPVTFAVLYGSVMALGQALHLLPGLDHFLGSSGRLGSTGHCCCHHHCGNEPEPGTSDYPSDSSAGKSSAGCPVCNFLALFQDRPSKFSPLTQVEPVELAVCLCPRSPCCEPIRLHSARGPPGALRCPLT